MEGLRKNRDAIINEHKIRKLKMQKKQHKIRTDTQTLKLIDKRN